MIGGNVPINRRYAVPVEIGVGFGKWCTAKKSIMRGQWRRVGTSYNKMTIPVNFGTFFLCFATPQDKYKVVLMLIELFDHRIGKMFPPLACMSRGLPISDSQTAI